MLLTFTIYLSFQATNKELCQEFQEIADKASTTPEDTDHLMRLKEYMDKAEVERLPNLELEVSRSRKKLEFLIEQTMLSR